MEVGSEARQPALGAALASSSHSPVCVPFLVLLAGSFRVCRQEEKMKEDCAPSSHVPISDSKSILK